MHGDKLALHGNGSYQVQKERLARTVLANDDSKCRSTFNQAIDVLNQCI